MTEALIVIGCSWGGPAALAAVLTGMPRPVGVPIVVVQHRQAGPSQLAGLLSRQTGWSVRDAEDKDLLAADEVFLAPPGYHLLVEPGHLALSTEGPVRSSRPSIDVLFESAAVAYGDRVAGVILSGTSDDGALGLGAIVRRGGRGVVQDPDSAERPAMPQAALATGAAAAVLRLEEIGPFLSQWAAARTR